jgi:hypothetical protein
VPTLETDAGNPLDVTPDGSPEAVRAQFRATLDDPGPDDKQTPKRQPRQPAEDKPKRQARAEKSRTEAKAPAALDDRQRSEGVKGWAQIGAAFALMASKATKNDAFRADAIVVASAAEDMAEACVKTAQADPKFAAALDKVCAIGPYGALVSVMVGVGSQLVRNHKPGLVIPGTVDPAEILEAAEAQHEPAVG